VKGRQRKDGSVLATFECSQYGRGRSRIIATVTRLGRASEDVYGVEEMGATLDAGVGLQGRTRVMAHARALARPERACARSPRGLA
jgi:hypothetical protein